MTSAVAASLAVMFPMSDLDIVENIVLDSVAEIVDESAVLITAAIPEASKPDRIPESEDDLLIVPKIAMDEVSDPMKTPASAARRSSNTTAPSVALTVPVSEAVIVLNAAELSVAVTLPESTELTDTVPNETFSVNEILPESPANLTADS